MQGFPHTKTVKKLQKKLDNGEQHDNAVDYISLPRCSDEVEEEETEAKLEKQYTPVVKELACKKILCVP